MILMAAEFAGIFPCRNPFHDSGKRQSSFETLLACSFEEIVWRPCFGRTEAILERRKEIRADYPPAPLAAAPDRGAN
jgi:hypothetical protein